MFISVDLKIIYNLQSVRTVIRLADAQVVAMRYGAIPSSASNDLPLCSLLKVLMDFNEAHVELLVEEIDIKKINIIKSITL